MRLIATWTKEDRGLGIGLLGGAIAIGSASPHLLVALGGTNNWRLILFISASLATLGGFITFFFIREGPYHIQSSRFNWKYAAEIFHVSELRLANLGYLGHMWELFAMWAWIGTFLVASFEISNIESFWASLVSFAVIAAGGFGSLLAGILADRFGRTLITSISLAISGTCSILVGFLFGGNPVIVTIVCLIWGFSIVADSAQFSAAISELCDREYTGTALTIQTSLGFLLTIFTIWIMPVLVDWIGWEWAFSCLAFGPIMGIWAMVTLRKSPAAVKMAAGNK
jgi:MFS family permease